MKKLILLILTLVMYFLLLTASGCVQSGIPAEDEKKAEKENTVISNGVTVDPEEITLPPGGKYLFKAVVTGYADTSVTWSILEGQPMGGTIDQGLYTAPIAVGDYHVKVTSNADILKNDTATVHVVTGASGDPYYTGTIVLEITGQIPDTGGARTFNDKETLYVMLDYDSSLGMPPLFTLWRNYIHTDINVTGKIDEVTKDSNGSIFLYITTHGWQSFISTEEVRLGINKIDSELTLDIYGIKYESAQMIYGGKVILQGYPFAGASIIYPSLPADLSHLSGTALQTGLPGTMQIAVTWDLKRTF